MTKKFLPLQSQIGRENKTDEGGKTKQAESDSEPEKWKIDLAAAVQIEI